MFAMFAIQTFDRSPSRIYIFLIGIRSLRFSGHSRAMKTIRIAAIWTSAIRILRISEQFKGSRFTSCSDKQRSLNPVNAFHALPFLSRPFKGCKDSFSESDISAVYYGIFSVYLSDRIAVSVLQCCCVAHLNTLVERCCITLHQLKA